MADYPRVTHPCAAPTTKYCYPVISARLACLIHAASVRSEPESNSPLKNVKRFRPGDYPELLSTFRLIPKSHPKNLFPGPQNALRGLFTYRTFELSMSCEAFPPRKRSPIRGQKNRVPLRCLPASQLSCTHCIPTRISVKQNLSSVSVQPAFKKLESGYCFARQVQAKFSLLINPVSLTLAPKALEK